MRGFGKTMRKKIIVLTFLFWLMLTGLMGRTIYLMVFQSAYYSKMARDVHERERDIKAERGLILDRNGNVLAGNKPVCTISVIHNQITDKDKVVKKLSELLNLPKEEVSKRVEKVSSIERIRNNVDKEIADQVKALNLDGVKVDEDYKRYYPYGMLASKVLGFTGADNQGIIGLEVKYEDVLKGKNGKILTVTDAKGREIEKEGERLDEPIRGNTLKTTIDYNIQSFADNLARQVMEAKEAEGVSIIVMRPDNGEIYAMVDVPEFDLNTPFDGAKSQDELNAMWRNRCISDTYEPGSAFKIFTASCALENNITTAAEPFYCPGYVVVEDRKIKCHKTNGHGSETFETGIMNSCNPVFVTVGLRIGADTFYDTFEKYGLMKKTGVDLPGEAGTIMHKKSAIGQVELATMSFGQSFQITPIQLCTMVSSVINGGNRITPHFAMEAQSVSGNEITTFQYPVEAGIVTKETSETMKGLLEKVVAEGGGAKGQVPGFRIGGKTATSQTLPRNSGRYISSFVGFAPADDPKVLALCIIYTPKGIYYGGQIAAPVVSRLFQNILPYLERMNYNES